MFKKVVSDKVDFTAPLLTELSNRIHANPEIRFEEHRAVAWISELLTGEGHEVVCPYMGLQTAFLAVADSKRPGPTVAILAEYDALPEIGHACGHNLIAASAVGAFLGVAAALATDCGLSGRVLIMGTPAEEGGGGKLDLIKAGAFKGIDAAMMFHPSSKTVVQETSLAINEVTVEFFGKAAHASGSPHLGINALDAVIQTFNGINALRQHIRDGSRIHGIITDGGAQPNIVPEHAAAEFYVRSSSDSYKDSLVEKLRNCAQGAALATGARLQFTINSCGYRAMVPNKAIGAIFAEHLESLGEKVGPPTGRLGSTDMGDVSQEVPSIHPYIAICGEDVAGHSREFLEASRSPRGVEVMLEAAKAMGMTAAAILANPAISVAAWEEFRAALASGV